MTAPVDLGFAMPFEGARHTRTWMGFPCREPLWHGKLAEARRAYAAVARTIARFEPVVLLANEADLSEARALAGPEVEVQPMSLDDSWLRDIGPTFLVDRAGMVAGADWMFNAWGRKWPDFENDAAVAFRIIESLGVKRFAASFVLEGGSIHVDGEGTLLTSEQCLLNPNRNPGLTRAEIEDNLKAWLGVSTIIWLGQGLENDDTDGHVDNLACFARPGVVLASSCEDPADPNHAVLEDNLARLRAATDAAGRKLEIVTLPIPSYREGGAGRLAVNYTNFYLPNGGVVAPSFDDPNDARAADILARVFLDRQIVQVPALDILEGGGGIHCITQQQPAGGLGA